MNKIITLFLFTTFFSSCATIFSGNKTDLKFNSQPQNAKVFVNGEVVCTTPCSVKVKNGPTFGKTRVQYRLENYKEKEITLNKGLNWVSVINLPNWIGWAIDIMSGAIIKYNQTTYDVELESKQTHIKIID